MLITAIEKRKGTRCAVYVDGEYAMMLDAEIIFNVGLKAGKAIDRNALLELQKQSDLRRTRERALYLLGYKSHTKKELTDKLTKTSDADTAAEVTGRMEELGLVNDEDYAERYARQLANSKGYGMSRIRQELYKKGVDKELIEDTLEQLAQTVDVDEKITAIIERKYARYLGDKKGVDKTINALIRLGYRYDDIRRVLNTFEIPQADDYDE
ncbi:RecX family transcriptional regulator [Hydrogenoanaerobacterium sp.]|uniref:regulatory protein RecX n=1 Tax=Hydrogenoanaerobacterium sp. TaxID=2953763 RepID=UPI00289B73D3|nr:RecX family transcriptional regulator [Hydrogenoanaerobacterium sp.]